MKRLFRKFFPEPPRWEAVAKGPASIQTLRYKIEPVEVQGTYVKERNQYGEERYWVTDPSGERFLRSAEQVTMQKPDLKTPGP